MKSRYCLILAALLFVPFAVYADDISKLSEKTNPGEWQTHGTVVMKVPGTNMKIPPQTVNVTKCVTQDDLNEMERYTPENINDMDCELLKKDLNGNTFSFSMKCSGEKGHMEMQGSTTFQSKNAYTTHVEMTGTMQNMPMSMTMDATAKRLGPCTKETEKD